MLRLAVMAGISVLLGLSTLNAYEVETSSTTEPAHRLGTDPAHRSFSMPLFARDGRPFLIGKRLFKDGPDCSYLDVEIWFHNGVYDLQPFSGEPVSANPFHATTDEQGSLIEVGTGLCKIRLRIERSG